MILDSSAVLCVLFKEPRFAEVLEKIKSADVLGIGAPTMLETSIVFAARTGADAAAQNLMSRLASEYGVVQIPFTDVHFSDAMGAWLRFGKGRHPAGLNFGDCLTYAIARVAGEPLLFVRDDFAQTDLEAA